MNLHVDVERVVLAHKTVRAELLAERSGDGHWAGHLASSPLATATAVSALVASHRRDTEAALQESLAGDGQAVEHVVQGDLSEFLVESVHWLARHQNPDGGWGDCDTARSNIAATMLVQAAFRLTGVPAKYADLIDRADDYITAAGGVNGLWEKYADDKVLVAATLANCALAGMVTWRQVPALPFELLCLPIRWKQRVQIPGDRLTTPALLAVGLAKFRHDPPRNPIMRLVRRSMRAKSLALLRQMEAADDSFLASVPMTAFVVMSLGSIGLQQHPIVQRGIEFLLASVRGEASWPVETNLSITNTALALEGLAEYQRAAPVAYAPGVPLGPRHAGSALSLRPPTVHGMPWTEPEAPGEPAEAVVDESASETPGIAPHEPHHQVAPLTEEGEQPFSDSLQWLLERQSLEANRLTEAPAGGWARSDAPGAVPNTNDTAGVLIAVAHWRRGAVLSRRERLDDAARRGIAWLLALQNHDGGWPTFYRASNSLPADASGADTTARALQALALWQHEWHAERRDERLSSAIERGWRFLESLQRDDGSFIPLWFGNEFQSGEHNPVYGTAQVLLACAELDRLDSELAQRAARWLASAQHSGGGWGPPRAPRDYSRAEHDGFRAWRENEARAKFCSVEETALAVTALFPLADKHQVFSAAVSNGLSWLATAIEQDALRRPAVVGFYFPKMWYHERLYPLVFAAAALSRAVRQLAPEPATAATVG